MISNNKVIFAVSNQKGGVGKTTTVLNLGVYLAKKGKKVLIVDIDPQANLTSGMGFNLVEQSQFNTIYDVLVNKASVENVIKETRVNNLHLIPSSIELAGAEIEIVNAMSRETLLKKALDSVRTKYDFILIDCPPSLGLLTINGHVAANKVLIPVQAEYFALEGLGQLVNTIKLVKSNLNNELDIGGVVLTMFDTRTNLSKDVATELQNFFGDKLFDTLVPRNIRLSEAPSHGLSIFEYDQNSSGAKAYERLAEELLHKFESNNKLTRPNLGQK